MSSEEIENREVQGEKPSIMGMITSPTLQLERIKQRPIIWKAMLFVIFLTVFSAWLITSNGVFHGFEDIVNDDDLAIVLEFAKWFGIIFIGIVGPLIGVLFISFIHWLIAKVAQSTVRFKQLFSMNTYIMVISAIGGIVSGSLFILFSGTPGIIYTSLGSVIRVDGAMSALFDSLEIFGIWTLILTAIGLHKVAGFSKSLGWTVTLILFLLGIGFTMLGIVLSEMSVI